MTEKQSSEKDSKIKEREEQLNKNISYHLGSLKDAQNNWQVFSGYLAKNFGEEGRKAYDTIVGDYVGTSNFHHKFEDYNSIANENRERLHQPKRRLKNEEFLEHIASSVLNSFKELSKFSPKTLESLLESIGSKDEKREKFVNELQKIREKQIDTYIKTGEEYQYTEEEKKIVDQTDAFTESAWRMYNQSNSVRAMNEYHGSENQRINDQIYTNSGLKERNEKLLEEQKKQEEATKNNKK